MLTDLLAKVPPGWSHVVQMWLGVLDSMHDDDWLGGLCPCGVIWTCEPLGRVA